METLPTCDQIRAKVRQRTAAFAKFSFREFHFTVSNLFGRILSCKRNTTQPSQNYFKKKKNEMSPIQEEEKHGLMPCACCDYFFNFFFKGVRAATFSWLMTCELWFFLSFFFFLVWLTIARRDPSLSLLSNNVRDVKGGTEWNGVTCAWYPLPTESVPMTKKMPF